MISTFTILPFAFAIFYHIFNYLLFLRPNDVPRREHTHQFRYRCSALTVASHTYALTYTNNATVHI